MNIAQKIREEQDTKEMCRRAIKMLKNMGAKWEDLADEFEKEYHEKVF